MFFRFRNKPGIKDANHLLAILGLADNSDNYYPPQVNFSNGLLVNFSKFTGTLSYRAQPKEYLYKTKGDKNHRIFQSYDFEGSNPEMANII